MRWRKSNSAAVEGTGGFGLPPRAMKSAIHEDLAFILHTRRFRENSLLVDALAEHAGRISLVARAPTRGTSRLSESLQPFRKVALAFSGRSDLLSLVRVEHTQPLRLLGGDRLLSGLYLNELVVRLTTRGEAEQALFPLYESSLEALAGGQPLEPLLRHFEVCLLDTCGYGLPLRECLDSASAVEAGQQYHYVLEEGPYRAVPLARSFPTSGAMLLALSGGHSFTPETLAESKRFMRAVLKYYLGDKPLHARSLFSHP